MQRAARTIKIGLTVFLFGALPLVIFTLITSKTGVIMGVRSFTVLSGSMEPTLPVGSIIYTLRQRSYDLGDVISVNMGGTTLTHRITQTIQKNGQVYYQLKGDANKNADAKLVEDFEVVGKQVVAIPFVGRAAAFLRTPIGFVSLVVLPALLLVGFELWTIKKELEIQIEKKVRTELGVSL